MPVAEYGTCFLYKVVCGRCEECGINLTVGVHNEYTAHTTAGQIQALRAYSNVVSVSQQLSIQ